MKPAPLPANEAQRLEALHRYDVVDTQPEKDFNDLVRAAAQVCGTPMAAVTIVDERRQWYKSRVGLPFSETPRHISFCGHAIAQNDLFVVEDARNDERFADNPLVIESPHIQFFAGMPFGTPDGCNLGTLAVMDHQPRRLSPEQADTLRVLARQVMTQLELRRNLVELARSVEEHQATEEQLRISEVFYHTLVETLPQAIFRKDRHGRFTFANQRFCDAVGRPLPDILGRTDDDFFPPDLAAKYRHDDQQVMRSGETLDTVEANQGPESEKRFVHVIKTPLYDAQGEAVGIQGIFWDVTARKRIEEALAYERELLRSLLDNLPDRIFFKDVNSRFIRCSVSQAKRLGLADPAEIVGKTDFDFYPKEVAQEFFEDEQRIILTGQPVVNKQQHHLDREGHETWSSVTKVPIYNQAGAITGIIGLTRDISQIIRAEQALRQAEEKYRAIYENAVEGIFQSTPDGQYLSANPALARLYGFGTPEELIAALTDIDRQLYVEPGRRDQFKRLMQEAGEVVGFESEIRRRDGSTIWISEAARAVRDARGKILYYEGLVEDITARKNAERAHEKARQAALESARVKAQFLANVSHEIRTPMNAILGMTDLLADTRLDPEQRGFLETIRGSAHALLDVINDVLDFSKMEAGKLELEDIRFDLRDVVEGAVEMLAVRAHQKDLELACWIEEDAPTRLRGDPARLRQVVINLLNNAIKFTERGEVVVSVSRVPPADAPPRLRFEVRDTGIGIEPGALPRIFQEFTQADGSTTRKYGGTGLGLTISKQLVELMGGQIGAESAPAVGSIFWFEIPVQCEASEAAEAEAESTPFAGRRALVIDDHAAQRDTLHRLFRAWKIDDTQAASPEEGLRCLREAAAGGRPYDVVLIDQVLPDTDGASLARTIKADPAGASAGLIMMTSLGNRPNPADLQASGIFACVVKPPRRARLAECLLRVLHEPGEPGGTRPDGGGLPVPDGATPGGRAPRVLLAEDNAVNQRVALAQLKKLGFEADAVSNGAQVLAALQAEHYDVVLMDCQMPEMDGYEAAKRIRAGGAGPRYHGHGSPYIIALTANAMKGDRERCLAMGMNDYLVKPLSFAGLDAALQRALGRAAPTPAPSVSESAILDRAALSGLRRLREPNQPDPLQELADLFIQDATPRLDRIEAALKTHDAKTIAATAHSLKGSASNLGARRLADLFLDLEQRAKAGDLVRAGKEFPAIRVEFDRVCAALKEEVAI